MLQFICYLAAAIMLARAVSRHRGELRLIVMPSWQQRAQTPWGEIFIIVFLSALGAIANLIPFVWVVRVVVFAAIAGLLTIIVGMAQMIISEWREHIDGGLVAMTGLMICAGAALFAIVTGLTYCLLALPLDQIVPA